MAVARREIEAPAEDAYGGERDVVGPGAAVAMGNLLSVREDVNFRFIGRDGGTDE